MVYNTFLVLHTTVIYPDLDAPYLWAEKAPPHSEFRIWQLVEIFSKASTRRTKKGRVNTTMLRKLCNAELWRPHAAAYSISCAASVLLVLLLIVAYVPVPWYGLVLLLVAMGYLSYRYAATSLVFHSRVWVELYLLPESTWRTWVPQVGLVRVLAVFIAVFLATVTYLSFFGERFFALLVITAMIALADVLCQTAELTISTNLVKVYAEIFRRRLSAFAALSLALSGLVAVDVCESLSTDHGSQTARSMARRTIEEVKHPVLIVRHWTRTIRYYDLTLLRIRDTLGWPLGWAVYLALLIPSVIPVAGAYSIYQGTKTVLNE